jgi:hypothetical protein
MQLAEIIFQIIQVLKIEAMVVLADTVDQELKQVQQVDLV